MEQVASRLLYLEAQLLSSEDPLSEIALLFSLAGSVRLLHGFDASRSGSKNATDPMGSLEEGNSAKPKLNGWGYGPGFGDQECSWLRSSGPLFSGQLSAFERRFDDKSR